MKRYLITGASRGIGRAIALRLAGPGIQLLLHGRDIVALAETCRAVEAHGSPPLKLIHDLATIRGVENLTAEVGHEPIDLLVGVNLTAAFLLIQHFAPRMRPDSSIVNVLSVAAKNAYGNWSIYCASKFALDGLTAAIREELRPHRVRVLNIYPAATDTEIWNAVAGEWPREHMMSAADVAEAVAFAINQPSTVAIENITLASSSGTL